MPDTFFTRAIIGGGVSPTDTIRTRVQIRRVLVVVIIFKRRFVFRTRVSSRPTPDRRLPVIIRIERRPFRFSSIRADYVDKSPGFFRFVFSVSPVFTDISVLAGTVGSNRPVYATDNLRGPSPTIYIRIGFRRISNVFRSTIRE